jgi:hypothetical protein
MSANSYWTHIDDDGNVEWVADPDPESSWWQEDDDGDGWNNEQEVLFGSDPARLDSDYDGLTDQVEHDLTPDVLGGGLFPTDPWKWDTDGNGFSDHDEFFYTLQGRQPVVNYNTLFANNQPFHSFFDADGDGHHNHDDTHPLNPALWNDHNDDGENDPPNEPQEPEDTDGDGHIGADDSHEGNSSLWCDWDGSGVNDDQDTDGDGVPDDVDTHDDDPNLWNDHDGDWVNDDDTTDTDGDGVIDQLDSHP